LWARSVELTWGDSTGLLQGKGEKVDQGQTKNGWLGRGNQTGKQNIEKRGGVTKTPAKRGGAFMKKTEKKNHQRPTSNESHGCGTSGKKKAGVG